MEKMKLIQRLIEREWTLFDKVRNIGGRASCQDDRKTFFIMRGSQFLSWNVPLLESYENDLRAAQAEGRNLLAEKYGYMMMWTSPKEFKEVRDLLPQVTDEKKGRVLRIAATIWTGRKKSLKNTRPFPKKAGALPRTGVLIQPLRLISKESS